MWACYPWAKSQFDGIHIWQHLIMMLDIMLQQRLCQICATVMTTKTAVQYFLCILFACGPVELLDVVEIIYMLMLTLILLDQCANHWQAVCLSSHCRLIFTIPNWKLQQAWNMYCSECCGTPCHCMITWLLISQLFFLKQVSALQRPLDRPALQVLCPYICINGAVQKVQADCPHDVRKTALWELLCARVQSWCTLSSTLVSWIRREE